MSVRSLAVLFLPLAAAACGGRSRSTSATTPSGQYTTQIEGYLGRLANNSRTEGYTRAVAGPIYGSLTNSASATHEMTVVSGNQYVLFGACDNDCRNLDLRIYDTAGILQMQDVAVDDTPVLTFTANASGKYRVVAVMVQCNRNPCYYGVQLMAK